MPSASASLRGLIVTGLALIVFAGGSPDKSHAGPILETYVLGVGGESTYTTFGPPDPVSKFFGGGGIQGVSLPTNPAGLAASNIAGGDRLQDAASGLLTDSTSINNTFGPTFVSTNTISGSAAANAQYGQVGASAGAVFTGYGDNLTVVGTEAYGLYRESFNVADPLIANGTAGNIIFHFTVDGSMSITGPAGTGGLDIRFQQNNGPVYPLLSASVDPRFPAAFSAPYTAAGGSGFSVTSTTISGSGVFGTFALPFVFGTPFDFQLGLFTFALPELDNVINVDFASTAKLTGIDVLDLSGDSVTTFAITSGSGTLYDAAGVHIPQSQTVPEPSAATLSGLAACISLGWLCVRRIRRPGIHKLKPGSG